MSRPAVHSVEIDGESLTPRAVEAVARGDARLHLTTDPARRDLIRASCDLRRRLVAEGRPIYGTTTGVGLSVDRQIGADRAEALQRSLLDMLGCGVDELLPIEVSRAAVVARANCLAKGYSGVREELIEHLVALLEHDVVPAVPAIGSVGASGDLIPASYVAAVVVGERRVFHDGRLLPTMEAYREVGLEPLTLEPKEALALVNGTNLMTGVGALAVEAAGRLAVAADLCTALATEALLAVDAPFEGFLHDVAKPHSGQSRSARRIRRLLAGSGLARPYSETIEGLGTLTEGSRPLAVRLQEPYSIRCAPQCVGALEEAADWARGLLTVELNSSNDNPLFDIEAGDVRSGGNFSGFHVGLAMDTLKVAVASVVDLIDRQFQLINDEKYNNGLGVCCRHPLPEEHPEAGIHHGFKGMQLAISAVAAEALHLTTPMTSFSRSTACHNQDKVSMGSAAARQARRVVELGESAVAMQLLILAQAADLRGAERLAPATRDAYDLVRSEVAYLERDRELDGDVVRVTELLREGRLAGLVAQHCAG